MSTVGILEIVCGSLSVVIMCIGVVGVPTYPTTGDEQRTTMVELVFSVSAQYKPHGAVKQLSSSANHLSISQQGQLSFES